jgi:hypothetical protein
MPSLSPSILVFGQFLRKNVASVQDLIWEQWVLPSQVKFVDLRCLMLLLLLGEFASPGIIASDPLIGTRLSQMVPSGTFP